MLLLSLFVHLFNEYTINLAFFIHLIIQIPNLLIPCRKMFTVYHCHINNINITSYFIPFDQLSIPIVFCINIFIFIDQSLLLIIVQVNALIQLHIYCFNVIIEELAYGFALVIVAMSWVLILNVEIIYQMPHFINFITFAQFSISNTILITKERIWIASIICNSHTPRPCPIMWTHISLHFISRIETTLFIPEIIDQTLEVLSVLYPPRTFLWDIDHFN